MLINKGHLAQPQDENCTLKIYVPFIEYQTLAVDTKNLRLITRLMALIRWVDPALAWDTSVYQYDEVVLPVNKVWTPEIHVTNGILTTMKHRSHDLLVSSNGTVQHSVIINAEVNCEVNLFNYPFAADECPVAIQTYSTGGCGTDLVLGELKMVDGSHGDWQTDFAALRKQRDDRNFIMVGLRIKYTNPCITLLLPSILIVLADLVSFALPLGGGERNTFKVTLVLSFTMFLNILNQVLPGDSQCSPVIRIHFCVCLILLVLSMLVSMVLTRVAQDGWVIFSCWPKCSVRKNTGDKEEKGDEVPEEAKADVSFVQLDASEDTQMLRKVVTFLEALNTKDMESQRCHELANRMDKIFFWFYFIFGGSYVCSMLSVMARYSCSVNHFDFWY
ncbi:5-hydroxytryptamine receptor 3A-like [Leuresthes tenuis]|uniref:5-hydroxytryptamine receptor 3A-like n=1 Tax=Leuresthes tenuis TaxID=355514 RepID=UPI003B513959